MVKQRMNALDVRATVQEMQSIVGLRLQNIYNLNTKMFLLTFGHGGVKKNVLLESGIRFHITMLEREKPKAPSPFVVKLRKHIRSWRLTSIRQMEHDRTILIHFGSINTGYYLIVELFSKGNLILTNNELTILAMQRMGKEEEVHISVNQNYPADLTRLNASQMDIPFNNISDETTKGELWSKLASSLENSLRMARSEDFLRQVLSSLEHFGPCIAVHIMTLLSIPLSFTIEKFNTLASEVLKDAPNTDLTEDVDTVLSNMVKFLMPGVFNAYNLIHGSISPGGFLFWSRPTIGGKNPEVSEIDSMNRIKTGTHRNDEKNPIDSLRKPLLHYGDASPLRYENFTPTPLAQFNLAYMFMTDEKEGRFQVNFDHLILSQGRLTDQVNWFSIVDLPFCHTSSLIHNENNFLVFRSSWGMVMDEFFYPTEVDKICDHNTKKINKKLTKVEKFERDFARRVANLQKESLKNKLRGDLIILNELQINEAIHLINGALALKLQWDVLETLVKQRKKENHPISQMIEELHLDRNAIVIRVINQETEEDKNDAIVNIEIRLDKTAHGNATHYFQLKKANDEKLQRTYDSVDKAAAGAARKAEKAAEKHGKEKRLITTVQSKFWWEKYFWFISSDGYLVLQARDEASTEIMMRKQLQLGDIIVFSTSTGALPCVVKNPDRDSIPIQTLEEAGSISVGRSQAWKNKVVVGSFWVYASSLIGGCASTGFLYSMDPQPLRPVPLSLGCAVLFLQSSIKFKKTETTSSSGLSVDQNTLLFHDEKKFIPPDAAVLFENNLPPLKPKTTKGSGEPLVTSPGKEMRMEKSDTQRNTINERNTHLTKHQKRKIQKINKRYGEQDDEDRLRGVGLNGNPMCQIQKTMLLGSHFQQAIDFVESKEECSRLDSDFHENSKIKNDSNSESNHNNMLDKLTVFHDFGGDCSTPVCSSEEKNKSKELTTGQLTNLDQGELLANQWNEWISVKELISPEIALDVNITEMASSEGYSKEVRPMIVCAPFMALKGYPYRMELTPCFTVKKGSVATSILNAWLSKEELYRDFLDSMISKNRNGQRKEVSVTLDALKDSNQTQPGIVSSSMLAFEHKIISFLKVEDIIDKIVASSKPQINSWKTEIKQVMK